MAFEVITMKSYNERYRRWDWSPLISQFFYQNDLTRTRRFTREINRCGFLNRQYVIRTASEKNKYIT